MQGKGFKVSGGGFLYNEDATGECQYKKSEVSMQLLWQGQNLLFIFADLWFLSLTLVDFLQFYMV